MPSWVMVAFLSFHSGPAGGLNVWWFMWYKNSRTGKSHEAKFCESARLPIIHLGTMQTRQNEFHPKKKLTKLLRQPMDTKAISVSASYDECSSVTGPRASDTSQLGRLNLASLRLGKQQLRSAGGRGITVEKLKRLIPAPNQFHT